MSLLCQGFIVGVSKQVSLLQNLQTDRPLIQNPVLEGKFQHLSGK